MTDRPRVLIEEWLPIAELGIESRRESAPIPGQFPKLKTLHVWWARRPLAATAGVVLASVMPAWSEDLAARFEDRSQIRSETDYREWFLRLCGVLGDPVGAKKALEAANAEGVRLPNGGYGYKQAFKNSPSTQDLALLHLILEATWGRLPRALDPTAGGGSIPFETSRYGFETSRYGLETTANELNPVAVSVLRAGVELPSSLGPELSADLRRWGELLIERIRTRLEPFFGREDETEQILGYLFARTVACPRTDKPVPVSPNWWLSKASGKEAAVRVITERANAELDRAEFEILKGTAARESQPDRGTLAGGDGISPWDNLAIDGGYIKAAS